MKITKMKAERRRRRWRQVDLSFHSNVPIGEISKIETLRMKPYQKHAERISKVLGISPGELQDLVEETDPP